MPNTNELYFGAAYCPYAKSGDIPSEYYERDIITMKKLGMNIIRPFVAWDRIEREEGVYDFSKLDLVFDLAAKHGMKIMLNLGGTLTSWAAMYPPRYIVRKKDVQELKLKPYDPPQFGPVRRLCMDDPYFLERAKLFLDICAERYCRHPALAVWSLWNEPFYHGDGCFCPLTMANFRKFLREVYDDDINRLNEKWGTEFPVDYLSFDEAEPGVYVSFSGGGYAPCVDYLKFNRSRVAGWLKVVRETIERHNPRKLKIGVNVVVTAAYNTASQHNHPSMFDQNYYADVPGFSAYTFFAMMEEAPYLTAAANSLCRSSGRNPASGFWAIEGEAGQISYLPERHDRAERGWRTAANYQLMANGAKMLMFWKFGGRHTDTQTDQFNLTGFDGSITERAEELSKSGKAFMNMRELLSDTCVHARAAILFAPDTELARICDKTYSEYVDACHGAFRILNELHIECDFIDERLFRLKKARYKVIIAPETIFLNERFAKEIMDFVRCGGTLIADYRFAQKREDSTQFQTVPGFGLQEAFGCFVNDFTFAESDEVFAVDGFVPVSIKDIFHAHLHLKGAESLAEYSCGGTALSKNSFGKGKVYTWGFPVFQIFRKAKTAAGLDAIRDIFRHACAEAGVVSDLEVCGDTHFQMQTGVLCQNDDPQGSKVCFLINFSDKRLECRVKLPPCDDCKEILSGESVTADELELSFAPYETKIFDCKVK